MCERCAEMERRLDHALGRLAAINRIEDSGGLLNDERTEWHDGWDAAVEQAKYAANWMPAEPK